MDPLCLGENAIGNYAQKQILDKQRNSKYVQIVFWCDIVVKSIRFASLYHSLEGRRLDIRKSQRNLQINTAQIKNEQQVIRMCTCSINATENSVKSKFVV